MLGRPVQTLCRPLFSYPGVTPLRYHQRMPNPLTPQQIDHYRTEGYFVAERLLDAADLQRVEACIDELVDAALASSDYSEVMELEPQGDGERPAVRRVYNPFAQHDTFRDLACSDRILDRVAQLIGDDIAIQHSKLNMKPARVGSVVEWHQDLSYFPHTNDSLVTLLIYLDDATRANGCLQVLPRRHDRFMKHMHDDGTFAGMITEPMNEEPVSLEAPAGSVIFMHCMTPHSSLPNTSDHARRTLIFEYRAADAYPIYMGEMTLRNEAHAVMLRGEPAPFARLGKVQPLIPRFPGMVSSLYDLQAKSRAAATVK